jgi:hypothetical protein
MGKRCAAARGFAWATLAAAAIAPGAAVAIAVSGPADLLPADFWIYVEGSDGAFARVEARDDAPVSIEIEDPVVGGVPMTGHFLLSAEALPTGPATKVNATLSSTAAGSVDADVDLTSLLTFDLAVLSATLASAEVRIVGEGIGGAAGILLDQFGVGSRSSSYGYVTLYPTNASGGSGPPIQTWEVPGNFTTTPIAGVVTLTTNQLYRIVVRSLASIDLRSPPVLEQYSYLFIDPQVGLVSTEADLELVVSQNLPEALPEPGAAPLAAVAALALQALTRRRLSGAGSPR